MTATAAVRGERPMQALQSGGAAVQLCRTGSAADAAAAADSRPLWAVPQHDGGGVWRADRVRAVDQAGPARPGPYYNKPTPSDSQLVLGVLGVRAL
jgi:hypothetical protein